MPLLHCGIDLTGDAYRAFRGKKLTCNASNGLEFVGAFFDDGDLDGHDELRTGRKSEKFHSYFGEKRRGHPPSAQSIQPFPLDRSG